MTYRTIAYDVADRVVTITLDREERRNTVTYEMLDELLDAFAEAGGDDSIRVVVVTGRGSCFSFGTDLSTGSGGYDVGSGDFKPLRGGDRDVGGELALRIFSSTKPVVAAINGDSIGIGLTMILPMDIRIAAESARFALPFARRGIVPESCATWFLPRIVGIATAVDWTVTGRMFPASEALTAGLVRELVPADQVVQRALAVAAEIASTTSAVSVALTRAMLWRQLGSPHPISANRLESLALLALGGMADAQEGVASFKQKRPADFQLTTRDLPPFYPWWADEPFDV